MNISPHIRPHKSCFSSVNLQNACVRAFFAPNTPLPFKRALARDRCNRLVNYGPPRAPATVIVTVIRLARPRATLSLNVIPKVPARPCATCVFLCERGQTFKSSRLSRSPKLSTLKSASLQSGSELNRTVVIPIFLAPSISFCACPTKTAFSG